MKNGSKILLLLLMVICSVPDAFSDDFYTQSEVLFDDAVLPSIYITIDPDSLDWLLEEWNLENRRYLEATFRYVSPEIDTTIESVGFRLRGNTSRYAQKKSFKISFGEFGDTNRFYGLQQINLNGEHNDPCIIRSKICWDLMKEFNAPSSRAAHVKLYTNQEYRGLYIHVEEYDRTFLQGRFGDDNGNLYKCLWPADLEYISANPDDYKYTHGERRAYDLRTNREEDDYTGLADFIDILNNTPVDQFQDELETCFNTWDFLQVLATEVTTGHWDNYWYNKNNFYLYHNLVTGKFEYIPFDMDNTFGIWWEIFGDNEEWGIESIYDWGNFGDQDRPLVDHILYFDQYRDLYSYFHERILSETFNDIELEPYIENLREIIDQAAMSDIYRTLDYGWSYQEFLDSYDEALGAHVHYGLYEFIDTRYNASMDQLEIGEIIPFYVHDPVLRFNPNPGEIEVEVDIFDDSNLTSVTLYVFNEPDPVSYELEFTEEFFDGIVAYFRFSGIIGTNQADGAIAYYLETEDEDGNISITPRSAPESWKYFRFEPLVINEFLASNNTIIADEFGEYDDWLELYNCSDSQVSLAGCSITDEPGDPDKWFLPDTVINPGDHLLIWTDGDDDQGDLHTTFRLDRDGEYIGLFRQVEDEFILIDSLFFGYQETDVSVGRMPGGTGNWESMIPSPGWPNGETVVGQTFSSVPEDFMLHPNYPNPFNPGTSISYSLGNTGNVKISIFNLLGQEVLELVNESQEAGNYNYYWNGNNSGGLPVSSGIYFYRLEVEGRSSSDFTQTRKMLLLR